MWGLMEHFYLIWAFNLAIFSERLMVSNYFFSWWCPYICKCVSGKVWMLAFWKITLFATQKSFLNVKRHLVVVRVSFFFFNVWKTVLSRLVFEVNLVFQDSGKLWFSETVGFEKNIEHCYREKLSSCVIQLWPLWVINRLLVW